jgi:hypothetical protein
MSSPAQAGSQPAAAMSSISTGYSRASAALISAVPGTPRAVMARIRR